MIIRRIIKYLCRSVINIVNSSPLRPLPGDEGHGQNAIIRPIKGGKSSHGLDCQVPDR